MKLCIPSCCDASVVSGSGGGEVFLIGPLMMLAYRAVTHFIPVYVEIPGMNTINSGKICPFHFTIINSSLQSQ